ncbi:Nucleic-acid-binding protein from transposon X-element [Eumeta japonica]|uniref:Nucleic-acid-binding protein from transposon X-element n=1 Tax=Eumeta variegata TaxID=151549 RepID=A0A4C1SWM6_EUMVA|nr:Nucleic-acid-binding protein from transposon X-element [Eumeta japonica]
MLQSSIKDLHHSTPHDAIIEAIEATNNRVKGEIINARYGPDKKPTSTFFVNIEPSINNPAVKSIKYIFNQKVKIEDPRKSKTIVQCQRCQQYGHSKNNCMRPYRCVKCGEGHKSSECKKKDRTTPAKCALCSCDHPANYKGCEIYKEILARRHKTTMPRAKQPAQSNQTPPSNPTVGNESTGNGNNTHSRSYADATSGKTPNQVNNPIVNWKICCSNKVRKWIS